MTDIRKKILKKINQGGSMMVEAMAMLALIALVTPTLYKKSAERTTELQDINTASHVRTLSKAVDNYVGANYQALLHPTKGLLPADGSTAGIALATLAPYLPYGYSFDELKNFGTPTVSVRRTADSVTAFVHLPRKTDIGQMRAARIASMIGSNGGYVNTDGEAKGVGGVWSLDSSGLNHLGFTASQPGSIVVASSEAINSATSGALENEKYLQRTPVPEGEEWRNTMTTDLYMGGLPGDGDTSVMHQILGVEKMIIGATEDGEDDESDGRASGLLIAGGKSAWIDGSLTALGDFFNVYYEGGDRVLLFGETPGSEQGDGTPIKAVSAPNKSQVNLVDNAVVLTNDAFGGGDGTSRKATASFYMDEFTVGKRDGDKYIYADKGKTELHKGELKVATDAAGKGYTSAKTKLYVGMDAPATSEHTPTFLISDRKLDVNGNAYVKDTLQANDVKSVKHVVSGTSSINKLRAGELEVLAPNERNTNKDKDDNYWLTVGSGPDGIKARDFSSDERMLIDMDYTKLKGIANNSALQSGLTLDVADATLEGIEKTYLRTLNTDGVVSIQDGAITATGQYNSEDPLNYVDINANYTTVNVRNDFQVNRFDNTLPYGEEKLLLATHYSNPNSNYRVKIDGRKTSFSYIDESDSWNNKKVLTVDYSSYEQDKGSDTPRRYTKDGSVYIRRGAIEIENTQGEAEYDANDGMGYIEASRFVSNAWDGESGIAQPVYSKDYAEYTYYSDGARARASDGGAIGAGYDRYMVNPAYTSVMHDIKLTSRGGARLSDILPDFINKGIYVVTNTYSDNIDIKLITPEYEKPAAGGRQVIARKQDHMKGDIQDVSQKPTFINEDRWASPFLGIVPAPQCPPGHAKLMTLIPAGFQMAQATSEFTQQDARNPFKGGGVDQRLVIEPGAGNEQDLGYKDGSKEDKNSATATTKTAEISDSTTIYYLGYDKEDGDAINTKPLYFQQSTWLRSMMIPQAMGITGDCSNQDGGCGSNFVGWSAIIGFVYPGNQYKNIIAKVAGVNTDNVDDELYYWNVFPVQTGTIEGYATVYCYFDRTNMLGSGNDGKYVDQYDQLNNFREGYKKADGPDNNLFNNADYLNRLDDPTLRYNDPW